MAKYPQTPNDIATLMEDISDPIGNIPTSGTVGGDVPNSPAGGVAGGVTAISSPESMTISMGPVAAAEPPVGAGEGSAFSALLQWARTNGCPPEICQAAEDALDMGAEQDASMMTPDEIGADVSGAVSPGPGKAGVSATPAPPPAPPLPVPPAGV